MIVPFLSVLTRRRQAQADDADLQASIRKHVNEALDAVIREQCRSMEEFWELEGQKNALRARLRDLGQPS